MTATADDGLARLRAWRDEQRGVPPAVGRFGATFADLGPATTSVRLPLTPELLLPGGRPSAAVPALLADIALTTSVVASLPDTRAVTTVAMAVDVHRLPPAAGELVARCLAAPYDGGRAQHAEGEVRDGDGRLVARVAGWFLPSEVTAEASSRRGLVVEEPAADVVDLLRLRPGDAAGTSRLVAREALSNIAGTLHGGVGALACVAAAEQVLGEGTRVLSASLTYLRGTPRDGEVDLRATTVRRGRRTAVVESALVPVDGRAALTALVVAAVEG